MVHEHVVLVPVPVHAIEPLPIPEAEVGPVLVLVPVPLPAADPLLVPKAEAGLVPVHVPDPEAEAKVEANCGMPSIGTKCALNYMLT